MYVCIWYIRFTHSEQSLLIDKRILASLVYCLHVIETEIVVKTFSLFKFSAQVFFEILGDNSAG